MQFTCEMVAKWRCEAEAGDSDAMLKLALAYQKGDGIEKSLPLAVMWYEEAIERGNDMAMVLLGCMYMTGEVGEKRYTEAFKLFEHAALIGNAVAECHLGELYRLGRGVKESRTEAMKWFLKSAEHGCEKAKECVRKMQDINFDELIRKDRSVEKERQDVSPQKAELRRNARISRENVVRAARLFDNDYFQALQGDDRKIAVLTLERGFIPVLKGAQRAVEAICSMCSEAKSEADGYNPLACTRQCELMKSVELMEQLQSMLNKAVLRFHPPAENGVNSATIQQNTSDR